MSSLSKYELDLFANVLMKTIEDEGATLYPDY